MISIMMCDDQIMFLDLVLDYLSKDPDFNIINRAASGDECLELIYNGCVPDILILDISMPNGISGYDVSKQLQRDYPNIKIIGLSMLTDCNAVKGMIRYGAKGFLFKDTKPCEIARIIKLVNAGEEHYPAGLKLSSNELIVLKNTPINWLENITRTETITAKLISTDISNNLVADEMNISVSAVNKKIKSLFKKTNTNSRIGLLAFLRRVGVLE
jgi:DNA-binding NarL/FixJ family response regulator